MTEHPKFLTIEELKARTRAELERQTATMHIIADHLSFPVPVRPGRDGKPLVALFNCVGHLVAGKGLWLVAPTEVLYLDPVTGRIVSAKRMKPSDLGIADAEGKTLGRYNMLRAAKTAEEFSKLQAELDRCYALLLEPFAQNRARLAPDEKTAAATLERLFWKLSEQPLTPYYQALGKDFFNWLDRVSR